MQQEDNGVDAVKEAFLNLLCKVEGEDFDEFDSFVRSALGNSSSSKVNETAFFIFS
jgi:hypothetical protein